MTNYFISLFVASFFLLDATYIGQLLLSEPIILLPILGLLTGNETLSFKVAVNMEFIFLGRLPVGASLPPFASFSAALFWLSFLLMENKSFSYIFLLFIFSVLCAYWGREVDFFVRKMNIYISRWSFERYEKSIKSGDYYLGAIISIIFTYILYAVNLFIASHFLAYVVKKIVEFFPLKTFFHFENLKFFWITFPTISILFLFDRFLDKNNVSWLHIGAAIGFLLGIVWVII